MHNHQANRDYRGSRIIASVVIIGLMAALLTVTNLVTTSLIALPTDAQAALNSHLQRQYCAPEACSAIRVDRVRRFADESWCLRLELTTSRHQVIGEQVLLQRNAAGAWIVQPVPASVCD